MISSLVSAAAFLVLAAQAGAPGAATPASEPTVEGVVVSGERPRPTPAEDLTDLKIEQELFKAWKAQPERVVCAHPSKTGTRLPPPVCGSLDRWFNARSPGEIADGRAPWQLVEEIKKNKRKAAQRRAG